MPDNLRVGTILDDTGAFGRNLAEIREWRGLTQEQLAEAAFRDKSLARLIDSLESGRIGLTQVLTVVRLAIAMDVSADDLLGLVRDLDSNRMTLAVLARKPPSES